MKVGIVGCGGLGAALVRGLGRGSDADLTVCDRNPEKVEAAELAAGRSVVRARDAAAAAAGADVLVLAVKPASIVDLLQEISPDIASKTLVVSVAAGVPLSALEDAAPEAAIARVMPNTGAGVGASTTACALGANAEKVRDQERLRALFSAVGEVVFVKAESDFHAATALSGSGPAFALLVLEAMSDAGVAAGLSRADANAFAAGALRAASALADAAEAHPAELRARITSPGGTTIAGLAALERAGVRGHFIDAVQAAVRRSWEMSEG